MCYSLHCEHCPEVRIVEEYNLEAEDHIKFRLCHTVNCANLGQYCKISDTQLYCVPNETENSWLLGLWRGWDGIRMCFIKWKELTSVEKLHSEPNEVAKQWAESERCQSVIKVLYHEASVLGSKRTRTAQCPLVNAYGIFWMLTCTSFNHSPASWACFEFVTADIHFLLTSGHSYRDLFNKYLLNTDSKLATILGVWDTPWTGKTQNSCSHRVYVIVRSLTSSALPEDMEPYWWVGRSFFQLLAGYNCCLSNSDLIVCNSISYSPHFWVSSSCYPPQWLNLLSRLCQICC